MPTGLRKAALVAHVGCSVGWLGAVVTSLVLAVGALLARDGALVRAVYLALEVIGWWALVPLSVAALMTGLVQSLGTSWGLLRHYWIVIKLAMNLVSTGVLLLYMQTLTVLANVARTSTDVDRLRDPSPVLHAAAAVGLLAVALVLSIYKPRGLTGYGRRRQHRPRASAPSPMAGAVAKP